MIIVTYTITLKTKTGFQVQVFLNCMDYLVTVVKATMIKGVDETSKLRPLVSKHNTITHSIRYED